MKKVKVEIVRGTVIGAGVVGVLNEVAEVTEDQANSLFHSGAAKPAETGAKVGKPEPAEEVALVDKPEPAKARKPKKAAK